MSSDPSTDSSQIMKGGKCLKVTFRVDLYVALEYLKVVCIKLFAFLCFGFLEAPPIRYVERVILNLPHP